MTNGEAVDLMMTYVVSKLPPACEIVYVDVASSLPAGRWIRATMKQAKSNQASLTGTMAKRKFTRRGVVIVECFSPVGDGHTSISEMTSIYQRALESFRNSPIWLRNVRIVDDIGAEGGFSRANVIADFEYDDNH